MDEPGWSSAGSFSRDGESEQEALARIARESAALVDALEREGATDLALQDEIQAREDAVASLREDLDAEIAARKAGDGEELPGG